MALESLVLDPREAVRLLQDELAATNHEVMALTLELEERVERRTAELRAAQEELEKTNSELLQLTLELENRVAERTGELHHLNETLEGRVRERTVQLERANQELEAFSYSVSHDLRAPLRAVSGFLELLRDHLGTGLDETGARYMIRILGASRQMGQLIDDLLSFSRLGRQELTRTRVDLGPLLRAVIEDLQPDLVGRKVCWILGDLPVVEGDPVLLRAVFQNLLGNAVKFTQEREEARIEVGVEGRGAEPPWLFVRDNGAGFDPTYAHKLFGVFQRLHRQDEFEGSGIGLANAHRIVSRHGGRIWAEGVPGEGATFYLTLPGWEGAP